MAGCGCLGSFCDCSTDYITTPGSRFTNSEGVHGCLSPKTYFLIPTSSCGNLSFGISMPCCLTGDWEKIYRIYLLPHLIEIENRNCWWDKVNGQLNPRYFHWILYTACWVGHQGHQQVSPRQLFSFCLIVYVACPTRGQNGDNAGFSLCSQDTV